MVLLQALIQLDRQAGTDALENLYNDNKQDNGQQHDQIFVSIYLYI